MSADPLAAVGDREPASPEPRASLADPIADPRLGRRDALHALLGAGALALAGCVEPAPVAERARPRAARLGTRGAGAVLAVTPLGSPWQTQDPFLACMHHDDLYPAGDARMGPAASLAGRRIGSDFAGIDGWRMYHGEVVPGFPQHPHRGFETVTVVQRGLLDHSDSLGATARYGGGDVQWLTAGGGILHAEMFPLISPSGPNPLELFQIWLNLPHVDKMVPPEFSMLWSERIPRVVREDDEGAPTELTVISGRYADATPLPAPRSSWASRPDTDVAIWTLRMAPGARFDLPAAQRGSNRSLYFFRGAELAIGGERVRGGQCIELEASREVELHNGAEPTELLMLQGRPIGEPVVQRGPFVMTTDDEIRQAFADYRRTQFGGWPWAGADPVHARTEGRFARHTDGRVERPT